MFYLFSSNSRDLYVQDILNIMALPHSALYQFRYEDKWVGDSLLAELKDPEMLKKYKGSDAIVVFVAQVKNKKPLADMDVSFYPLRRAQIRDLSLEGKVLRIQFELGCYVNWELLYDQPQTKRNALLTELLDSDLRPPNKYVVSARSILTTTNFSYAEPDYQTKAWQHAIIALNNISDFKNTIFFRVSSLKEIRETFRSKFWSMFLSKEHEYKEKMVNLVDVLPQISGYQVKSGTTNLLYLDFYHLNELSQEMKENYISANLDKSYFSFTPKPIYMTFRYDSKPIPLVVTSVSQDIFTGLEIKLINSNRNLSGNGEEGSAPIRAPEINLLIKLSYPRFILYIQFFLLIIAQFLLVLAGKFSEISKILNLSEEAQAFAPNIDLFLTIASPIISAIIIFFLFRKLPSFLN